MIRSKSIIYFFILITFLSCSSEEEKASLKAESGKSEKEKSESYNVVMFLIPGLNNDIFSLLLKDQNALAISRFNSIGSYAPMSYFKKYSDLNSNLTALMSGKDTRIGHLGIDKDSALSESWVRDFKKHNYHISYVSNDLLGSAYSASLFSGDTKTENFREDAVKNMLGYEPDFIWGMGTNLFIRRKDNSNLFDELSVKNYDLTLRFGSEAEQKYNKVAGVFNNYSLPDTIDICEEGLKYWNKKRSSTEKGILLIILIENLDDLLEGGVDKLYSVNRKIDLAYNSLNKNVDKTLYLLINPFQNREYNFNITEGDSLSFNSEALNYNQMNNNIWAFGAQSQRFSGNYNNTDFHKKLISILKD